MKKDRNGRNVDGLQPRRIVNEVSKAIGFLGVPEPSFSMHIIYVRWYLDKSFWRAVTRRAAFALMYEGEVRTSLSMDYETLYQH